MNVAIEGDIDAMKKRIHLLNSSTVNPFSV